MHPSLFAPDPDRLPAKPAGDRPVRMHLLIVVKAAPTPSKSYGETVCVAALRLDGEPGWVRLYPVPFRELEQPRQFRKYDIVKLEASPNRSDRRAESWRPNLESVTTVEQVKGWKRRKGFIADHLAVSMCQLVEDIRTRAPARSLAAIRPARVQGLDISRHPGWTASQQAKIDAYMRQPGIFDSGPATALEAPRFQGWYRYQCTAPHCRGHRQGVLDWEFVAHQRRLHDWSDVDAVAELRRRWMDQMCAPSKDLVFFVGNQAKRENVFSVLGVFYPDR